jgi:hypothetical protein
LAVSISISASTIILVLLTVAFVGTDESTVERQKQLQAVTTLWKAENNRLRIRGLYGLSPNLLLCIPRTAALQRHGQKDAELKFSHYVFK